MTNLHGMTAKIKMFIMIIKIGLEFELFQASWEVARRERQFQLGTYSLYLLSEQLGCYV